MAQQKIHLLAHINRLDEIFSGNIDPLYLDRYSFIELAHLIEIEKNPQILFKYIIFMENIFKVVDFEIAEFKKDIQKVKCEINFEELYKISNYNLKHGFKKK